MNPGICIQVSLKSQRLPLKALLPLDGRPMLDTLITRLEDALWYMPIAVCVPNNPRDYLIESVVERRHKTKNSKIFLLKGSELNLAKRFMRTNFDPVIRVTGDNPLTDTDMIIRLLGEYIHSDAEYVYPTGIPRGVKSEIISHSALKRMAAELPEECQETEFSSWLQLNVKSQKIDFNMDDKDESYTCDTQEDYEKLVKYFNPE